MSTPSPAALTTELTMQGAPSIAQPHRAMGGKATNPAPADYSKPYRPEAAKAVAEAQHRLAAACRHTTTPNHCRMVAILHNAAMDLWDVATETDAAQMWEEARSIVSRILAACPNS